MIGPTTSTLPTPFNKSTTAVLDQKGPTELCDYMVEWVREHWQFRPNVSYRVPVYFELN
jgi:hypothetical protein